MKTIADLWENHHLYNWKGEICPSMASNISDLSWQLENNFMGMYKDLTCTSLKWWCGSQYTRNNSIQKSQQRQEVWAWLNDSRKAPSENQEKMKSSHPPNVYLAIGDENVNPQRSTNLDQNGKYAPVWHRMCDRSKRSNDIKSSISKYVILVVWIHNWIIPTYPRCTSWMEKHDGI